MPSRSVSCESGTVGKHSSTLVNWFEDPARLTFQRDDKSCAVEKLLRFEVTREITIIRTTKCAVRTRIPENTTGTCARYESNQLVKLKRKIKASQQS